MLWPVLSIYFAGKAAGLRGPLLTFPSLRASGHLRG